MTREEQIIKIGAQFAIDETDGQTSGRAASMRGVLLSAFRAGAHWADQYPHWISVEDELPKEENAYLVSDGDGVLYGYFIEGRWAPTELNETCTHWMPLPKAPRKED